MTNDEPTTPGVRWERGPDGAVMLAAEDLVLWMRSCVDRLLESEAGDEWDRRVAASVLDHVTDLVVNLWVDYAQADMEAGS